MESTSEVAYEEQTKSSVSKKCVQEVSTATIQVSSSSMAGEKNVMSILGSNDSLVGNQIISFPNVESAITLPLISSPTVPDDDNAVNTKSMESEFSALKLKDDYGNEIGEIVQQKQQSVQASSSLTSVGSTSKTSSSLTQVSSSATSSSKVQQSIVAEAQESSTSVSCSSYSSTKKQEILSSGTRSLSSIKSSQSIEKVLTSSATVVEDQQF